VHPYPEVAFVKSLTRKGKPIGLGVFAGAVSVALASPAFAAGGWSVVPAPQSAAGNDMLNAVAAVSETEAWTVGTTFTAPDANFVSARPLALHWTGSAWRPTALPPVTANTALFGIGAASATDAWAVGKESASGYRAGKPVTLHWTGGAWSTVAPLNVSGFLAGVADLSPTNAYAVGTMNRSTPLVEHWDGTQWGYVVIPEPDPAHPGATGHLTAISARAANDIWVVGSFSTIAGSAIESGGYALHYNGSTWTSSILAGPAGANPSGVVAVGPNDVYATVNTSATSGTALIEHWNGSAWTIVLTRPATEYPTLTGVTARSATDVWAVGGFLANIDTPSPVRTLRSYHWNGTAWSIVDTPTPSGGADLSGVARAPGSQRLWAVGTATGPYVLTRTT
jgi:hypothetical protein